MATNIKAQPEGYHTLTPYLIISGAQKALDFYRQVFQAVEVLRIPGPEGRIMHAELKIGDSHVMVADEVPDMGFKSPASIGGTPVSLLVYVPDVDATAQQAVAAGAHVLRPVQDQFYGDRSGTFVDPFGHVWTIATHVEDVPPEEMQRRLAAYTAG